MARPEEKPQDYKGPREAIIMKHACGFCNAGDHHMCMHELPYYEKLWICSCECNKGWKPKDLGSTTPEKKRRKIDEVRDMQLPAEPEQLDNSTEPGSDVQQ
jgi:C4-type Zn-finger protein